MQYFRDSSSSTSVNKSSASNSSSNFVHHRSPFQGSQQHLPTRPDTPVFDQPTTHLEIPELLQDAEQSLSNEDYLVNDPTPAETATKKKILLTRSISLALVIGLLATIYVLWRPASTTTTDTASTDTTYATAETSNTTQTSPQNSKSSSASTGQTTGIQAYIVGEIHHPGVYTLDTNARVYQLVQAAGGPLTDANLAALNLAARLSDGQEVYVARLGETPPANIGADSNSSSSSSSNASTGSTTTASGTTVDINTAAAKELQQTLHISSSNAQKIVDYRLQHGPYTSITTLAQILSSTVYKKVKDHVTL